MIGVNLETISDDALFGRVEALARTERFTLIDLLIHLGELDSRGACQKKGYASAFAYLTRRLGYAESAAIRRVRVARAARKYPSILRLLAKGEISLEGIALIQPVMTAANYEGLIRKACRRSTREIERLVADMSPERREPRDRIRALPPAPVPSSPPRAASVPPPPAPARKPAAVQPVPPPPAAGESAAVQSNSPPAGASAAAQADSPQEPALAAAPAAPRRRRIFFGFTADEEVEDWYKEARDLLCHRFPDGDMEQIIGHALRRLVEEERAARTLRRKMEAASPQEKAAPADGRRVPKRVEDEVWRRDGGRCAFIGGEGTRCGETAWLELDHVVPWALGGRSDDPGNIRLLCRAHNQSEARRLLGPSAGAFQAGGPFAGP